jgi:hypothetical protein
MSTSAVWRLLHFSFLCWLGDCVADIPQMRNAKRSVHAEVAVGSRAQVSISHAQASLSHSQISLMRSKQPYLVTTVPPDAFGPVTTAAVPATFATMAPAAPTVTQIIPTGVGVDTTNSSGGTDPFASPDPSLPTETAAPDASGGNKGNPTWTIGLMFVAVGFGAVMYFRKLRPSEGPDGKFHRHDFGPNIFITRCSTCHIITKNRGDRETGKVYCGPCYQVMCQQRLIEQASVVTHTESSPHFDGKFHRHDFGPSFTITKCSVCSIVTKNRGDKESGLVYCGPCFQVYNQRRFSTHDSIQTASLAPDEIKVGHCPQAPSAAETFATAAADAAAGLGLAAAHAGDTPQSTATAEKKHRHDFGVSFMITKCTVCGIITKNRGDKESGRIYCGPCFQKR